MKPEKGTHKVSNHIPGLGQPLTRGFKRANSTAPAVNAKEDEKAYMMELSSRH